MTVRLRPHHLLCVLTYVGRGYSPQFVANFDAVVARIAAGESVAIHDGLDDICEPLRADPSSHCTRASVAMRDAQALEDVGRMMGRVLCKGDILTLDESALRPLRQAFAAGTTRAACARCQWSALCSEVADAGFEQASLRWPAPSFAASRIATP